jgi:hypothetical protein
MQKSAREEFTCHEFMSSSSTSSGPCLTADYMYHCIEKERGIVVPGLCSLCCCAV